MKVSQWRISAQIVIKKAIDNCPSRDKAEIRKAIDSAYPFGERKYHPYKIWLSVRKQYLAHLGIETKGKPVKEYRCKYCKDSKEGCLFCFR
ncbi:hypothetical protein PN499_22135 [Kamptonema animale CS-326]|uniref:hypothetical protein n=1 Tax=Kamptonema animale TaxID=92934 RepID=UPI00232F7F97|nr:hypothetical protein [Kamptonema animale]MDB9513903.1 hypothetical protein [Kamptonema animale CS-326]